MKLVMVVAGVALVLAGSAAHAIPFDRIPFISNTLGDIPNRLCAGAATPAGQADIACPSYSPYVTSGGFLGVGTSSPTATLQVSGSFIVSNSAYPSYPSLYVGTDGKVGIGTKSPSATLHVATTGKQGLYLDTDSESDQLVFLTNHSKKWDQYLHGNDLRFYEYTNGADRVTFQAGGNVGIGTTSPVGLFQVGHTTGGDLTGSGTASASSSFATNPPSGAFNGGNGYGWGNNNAMPSWLEYDFGVGNTQTLTEYSLYRSSSQPGGWENNNFSPNAWTFQGSNDNASWTTLDTQSGQLIATDAFATTYTFANTTAYRYYRIYITAANSGNWVNISSMRLMDQNQPEQLGGLLVTAGGKVGIGTTTPATALEVSGTVSATHFVGDGSGLTGVTAAATDRITSGTTQMVVVSSTGYVSLTQASINTGWFDPTRGLVTLGVSATGPISGTGGYFSGNLGIGTTAPADALDLRGTLNIKRNTANYFVKFTGSDGNGVAYIDHTEGTTNLLHFYGAGANTSFRFSPSGAGTFIIPSGNVGIATTAPSRTLHVSGSVLTTSWTGINFSSAGNVTPTAPLEVSGTVSATHFVGDGSGLTNLSVQGDRITSGTTSVIANQNTGVSVSAPLEVSGTISATALAVSSTATGSIQLTSASSVTCDAAHIHTIIWDDATGSLLICRQ